MTDRASNNCGTFAGGTITPSAKPVDPEVARLRAALERIAVHGEANAHLPKMSDLAEFARDVLAGDGTDR